MAELPERLRQALAGRYDLEAIVGRGGMATVYRARDTKHGRTVAVKVLRSDLGELIGPDRFVREIEIAARLMHPHILPLYDSGEAAGILYYVMPFVADESLRGLLDRVRLVDRDGAVEIVTRLAGALDYAHADGILHRDIKPENILLPGGQAVLADFGIAKAVSSAAEPSNLTRTGIALGTPGYMSPEQAAGMVDLGRTTDIYSLGVVTYEMLVGGLPRSWVLPDALGAGRFLDAPSAHRQLLDRLPPGTERALVRALAVRSEDRFETAGEFASALQHPETVAAAIRADLVPAARSLEPIEPRTVESATVPTLESSPASEAFLGAPTRLVIERIVPGLLPEGEHDYLLEEIRTTLGRVGYGRTTGHSLFWTSRKPKQAVQGFDLDDLWETIQSEDAPNIMVRVFARQHQTRIRIEQRLGEAAGGIFGGVWGGGGGGGAAAILGVGLPLGASVALIVPGAILAVTGTYFLSRAIYRTVVASRTRILEDLADRLAEQCAEVTR